MHNKYALAEEKIKISNDIAKMSNCFIQDDLPYYAITQYDIMSYNDINNALIKLLKNSQYLLNLIESKVTYLPE